MALKIADEDECTRYDSDDYRYPQSVERLIAERLGGMWSPYDLTVFESLKDSDIEHIVAKSEAHESGACAWDESREKEFARDLDNLTLATPCLNRYEKVALDAAEWLPESNRCWFATRVVAVKLKYGLTVDRAEANRLEAVLSQCSAEEQGTPSPPPPTIKILSAHVISGPYDKQEDNTVVPHDSVVDSDGVHRVAPERKIGVYYFYAICYEIDTRDPSPKTIFFESRVGTDSWPDPMWVQRIAEQEDARFRGVSSVMVRAGEWVQFRFRTSRSPEWINSDPFPLTEQAPEYMGQACMENTHDDA